MAEIDATYYRGRGGCGRGKPRGSDGRSTNDDGTSATRKVTGIAGKIMEVHPSYNFIEEEWYNISREEKNRLIQARKDYNSNKRARLSKVHRGNEQTARSGGGHIMGGRNEQEALRQADQHNA